MSDLISRQTVLRCIKESRDNIDWGQSEDGDAFLHYTGALYRTVASEECLPSAEPETASNGSITCVKSEKMHDRTMGDLISRQDAKDAIDMALDHIDHVPPWVYDKLLNVLNEVSSAEKAQLSGEDATSVCKCPCVYREPCDYCHYDAYRGHGCPAEEGMKDE